MVIVVMMRGMAAGGVFYSDVGRRDDSGGDGCSSDDAKG